MPLMFWSCQTLGQYICHLLGISATLDHYSAFIYLVTDPMVLYVYVLGSLMELGIPRHSDGTVIVTSDDTGLLLWNTKFHV